MGAGHGLSQAHPAAHQVPPCPPTALPSLGAPVAEPELAHGEAVGPATGVAVGSEDLLFVLLGLDVLLPLLLTVAVFAAEPAVVAHLVGGTAAVGAHSSHFCPDRSPQGG